MRMLTLFYGKFNVNRFDRSFRRLNWKVKSVNYLDVDSVVLHDSQAFLLILPDVLSDDHLALISRLKLNYGRAVLVLDRSFSSENKRRILNSGADWYFAKPFSDADLCKYINFFSLKYKDDLRVLRYKDIVLNFDARTVTRNSKVFALRNREFELLRFLLENHGVALSRTRLLEEVWDMNMNLNTTTLESHICKLRRKLDSGFKVKRLHTVHCVGYKIE